MLPALRRALALLSLSALAACGGPQRGGANAEACRAPSASMNARALDDAAACWAQDATPEAAPTCRTAISVAPQLSGQAAGDFAACVLAAGERADGAWLGELLAGLSSDALLGALEGAARTYDASVHGNSFAAALPASVQDVLGPRLGELSEGTREWIVSTALGYALHPLAGYCGPYVRSLDVDDPGVAGFARIAAASNDTLDESERWALAASGEWSAADLIACHAGEDARCADWAGESPLALMAEVEVEAGNGMAPQRALGLLRSGGTEPIETEGLTRFLSGADYAQRTTMVNAVMIDMTDEDTPLETRMAMARGASPAMCAVGVVVETMLRAHADPETLVDATRPWPSFVSTCLEQYWEGPEIGPFAASGSRLGVPPELYDQVVRAFQAAVADAECSELVALTSDAVQRVGNRALQSGMVWVHAARATDGRCDAAFEDRIVAVSRDPVAHPEGRLTAVEWRLDRGDDSACEEIAPAMEWYHEDLREGPSPWSESHAQELRRRCR